MEKEINFAELRESFADPGAEYRPAPFWFWNSKLDPDEIERQVRLMQEAGLGGFFMHARFGLETEYMGDEWMKCIRRAVQAAHQCGIYAWLYDEYPFPSGVGGLEVTGDPKYCNKFIDLVDATLSGSGEVSLAIPDGEPILAYAVPAYEMEKFDEKAILIQPEKDGEVHWQADEGEWRIMVFVKRTLQDPRGNVFGPDYLNPKMTKKFLNVLNKYVEDDYLKRHLGETIPGIFTDEPCILAWHQNHTNYPTRPNGRIAPWGDEIPQRLQKIGYDWRKVLPAVFYDLGKESAEFRHAYRQAIADSYVEGFFVPYQRWCKDHDLKLTGHLLLEEGLYTNTIFQGDFIRDLSLFDIPGSDHLGIGCEGKYGGWGNLPLMSTNIQGQKLVSSIAHIYGKSAVLSESFGVSGWGLTMADMKRIVDWQYRLGINLLCPHAFYYSMEGFRKYDSPPSQFYQATYWKYYRHFTDYVARLSLLMRAGRHVAQGALFYPPDSFWEAFKAGQEGTQDRRLADQFDLYASLLLKCHVDYDIVPAQFITPESVRDGSLRIGAERYEIIVLPSVSNVSVQLFDTLLQFYEAGGKILLTSPAPDELLSRLKASKSSDGKFIVLDSIEYDSLKDAIGKLLIPDVRINHKEITYIHREIDGKHIYFFASDSEQSLNAEIEFNKAGCIEHWNMEDGWISDISAEITADGYMKVCWNFAPRGSLTLVIDPDRKTADSVNHVTTKPKRLIQLSNSWDFACESPNALPLDHWDIRLTTRGDWLYYDYFTDVQMNYVPESLLLLLDDVESRSSFMAGMRFQIFVNDQELMVTI